MRVCRLLTCLVLYLVVLPGAYAETVYVTDELKLRLQAEPTDTSAVVGSLASGDQLELLDKAGFFALVKTLDGKQGWAKAGYLTSEKPARARLKELEARLEALQASVEPGKAELAKATALAKDLGQQLEVSQLELAQRGTRLEKLEQDNTEFRQQLGIGQWKIPWRWAAAGVIVALLTGMGLGLWWFDYRSRERHGGFRIY